MAIMMIDFARIASDSFLITWNIASAGTFLLPLIAFTVGRVTNQAEENQNQDNNNNNQYQNNYNNPDYYDEYGNYVGPTPWWQFWKSNGYYEEEDERSNDENGTPWWYIWGEREGQERREEEGTGAFLFAYLWTLGFFACLLYVGNTIRMTISKLQAFRLALFCFANYCFVVMVLLIGIEDAIQTEGREMEEDGFYGQRSVLLLVTCFLSMVQSIVFIFWTGKRIKHLSAEAQKQDAYVDVVEYGEGEKSPDYKVTLS